MANVRVTDRARLVAKATHLPTGNRLLIYRDDYATYERKPRWYRVFLFHDGPRKRIAQSTMVKATADDWIRDALAPSDEYTTWASTGDYHG
jgi:hypothetical protein